MKDAKQTTPGSEEATSLTLAPGVVADEYRVLRLIGRGGTGEVYLAQDTRLGRKVALKVVTQEALRHPTARERFLREARVTAQFSHPHIVVIHGAGEVDDYPYLALEYLPGQTLRERMDERRPGLREALRFGLAMVDALAEAHRHHVLHRDLKPQNIIIPRDGRLRVVDFGLAKRLPAVEPHPDHGEGGHGEGGHGEGGHGEGVAEVLVPEGAEDSSTTATTVHQDFPSQTKGILGTPAYMAPEQWQKGPVSGATDIWAFGIVLHELFSGRHPFQGAGFYQLCHLACSSDPIPSLAQTAETLPPALIELVDRCLSKSPKNRPSAVEASKVLERLLSGTDRRVQENPFRGLLPFAERHADLFFGREVEIDTFLEQLRTETVLPVVGPSGAGKSSFVQAGVIPRLREQGSWLVLRMRPGRQPFETLAARLTAGESTMRHSSSSGTGREWETSEDSESLKLAEDKLAARLAEVPERLSLELASLAKNQRVLLFVDQLEELYTLVDSEQTRRGFMQALCATAGDPAGALRVVFTLRDDFLGRMADGAQAREALSHVTVLRAPGPLALRETLERPVAAGGYTFEDAGLPEEMVSEVAGEDAALPLLQFAGQQLWERRDQDRHLLTRRAHTEMGGVAGALAQHTDATLGGLSPDQERIAQRIFIRLVTPDLTRQVLPHSQLLEGLGPGAEKVLERLTNARTILVRKGSHEAELELVHESLIRNWDRLARWLDESREERQFLSEVGRAADLWERRGRSEAEVWQGDALTESLLKARMCPTLPGSVPRFLAAGEARRDRAHKRRRLLWTGAFILVVLIALVAVAVSLLVRRKEREAVRQRQTAQLQKRRAEQKQREAIGHRAAALREGARAALAHQSLVEARAKLRSALELGDSPLGRVLWQRISHHPLRWKRAPGANLVAVAYSPDGKHVAAASQDHAVYLINVASGGVQTLRGHKDQVMRVAFSPDGKRLASASWKGAIRIWNVRTGRSRTLAGHGARIWGLTFDPSGRRLASACESDEIRLWDTASGRQLRLIRVAKARLSDVAFSPDGRRLATASFDKTVRLFDAQNGHLLRVLKGHTGRLWGVAFRPPLGRQVASAGMDRTIRIWDAGSGRLIRTLSGHQAEVYRVHYSADGKLLASASDDKTIRIWDASSGRLIRTLTGHESRVWEAAFSPSGRLLVSASTDNTARLWDLRNAAPPAVSRGHSSSVDGVDFSPDSRLLASASTDNTVRLWDVATGGQLHVLRHQAQAWDVAFHPQGQHLVSTSSDRTLRIWKVRTGRLVRTLKGHRSTVRGVAYSPDGGLIASASDDKTVRIWDADTGAPGKVLRGHEAAAWGADFSADGRILSSASADRTVRLWDVKTGRLRRVLRGHSAPVWTVHFRRDGQRLVTASSDKTARIWNARTGALISTLGPYPYRIYNAQFQGEGLLIGVTSSDRKARIITLASRKTVVLAGHGGDANSIAFSPNGRYAATTSDDTTVRLWDVATGRPVWRAPLLRTNPPELYSHRGWQRLDGQPGPKTPRRRKWRQAVANGARYAAQAGRWLCLSTGDELEVWDTAEDRRIQRVALGGLVRLIAFAGEGRQGGCVTLAHSIARLHRFGAAARPVQILRRDAVTIGLSPGRILVASPSGVHLYSRSGAALRHITAQMGIRAVAQVGDQLVLGFKDGGIELIPLQRQQQHHRRSNFRFAKTPSGPVTRLAQGPMGTLVAGYANGEFGLWSMANGDRLLHRRLHGPVAHLLVHKQKLYAASILGQHQTLDLAALYTPYCQLLRLVWKSIPIIWENGLPLRKAPSKNHHCR